jgi:hypothetical protein
LFSCSSRVTTSPVDTPMRRPYSMSRCGVQPRSARWAAGMCSSTVVKPPRRSLRAWLCGGDLLVREPGLPLQADHVLDHA